ncbi:6471_t:CDS:2 [Rhizophagus irregularis]|nr:6471_t:CDS:2 [Rhizophagus irregularis]
MLADIFRIPNNGVRCRSIKVLEQSYHFNLINSREKRAQDIAVCPSTRIIARPNISHPGPPPSDLDWPTLRILMHGIQNVKCGCASDTYNFVFGIKLDRIRNNGNRSMLARLWTRMNPILAGFVALTDPTLPGVSVKFWDFGTLQYSGDNPTGCIRAGLPNYQTTILVLAVFWNPLIVVNAGLKLQIPLDTSGPNFLELKWTERTALDFSN